MIFCKFCKYCKYDEDASYSGEYICLRENAIIEKHDFYNKWIEHRFCEHKNSENNCPDFQQKISFWR